MSGELKPCSSRGPFFAIRRNTREAVGALKRTLGGEKGFFIFAGNIGTRGLLAVRSQK